MYPHCSLYLEPLKNKPPVIFLVVYFTLLETHVVSLFHGLTHMVETAQIVKAVG
jgi:hypothetical protein